MATETHAKVSQNVPKEPWQMTLEERNTAGWIEAWHGSNRKHETPLSLEYGGEKGGDITKGGYTFSTKDVAELYRYGLTRTELVKMWGEEAVKKIEDKTTTLHGYIRMRNPLVVDTTGYNYEASKYTSKKDGIRSGAFKEYVKQMEDGGYDGLILKNVKDTPSGKADSTVYFFKDSSQFVSKPVPPEVLKDYPDLQAKVTPTPGVTEMSATGKQVMAPLVQREIENKLTTFAQRGFNIENMLTDYNNDLMARGFSKGEAEAITHDALANVRKAYPKEAAIAKSETVPEGKEEPSVIKDWTKLPDIYLETMVKQGYPKAISERKRRDILSGKVKGETTAERVDPRTPHAIAIDNALLAKNVTTNRAEWEKHRSNIDLRGVDTPKRRVIATPYRSKKKGRIYHTRVGKGTVLSRKPLGKRKRNR